MGVSRFSHAMREKTAEVAKGLVAPVALFEEWVAIHVVSVTFSECLACQRAELITQLGIASPLQNDY